jgi:hypothetical protein
LVSEELQTNKLLEHWRKVAVEQLETLLLELPVVVEELLSKEVEMI